MEKSWVPWGPKLAFKTQKNNSPSEATRFPAWAQVFTQLTASPATRSG